MDLDVKVFRKMVRDVATSTSKNFPAYVDPLDVEQELWLWLYSEKNWVTKAIEGEHATARIGGAMHKQALEYCNNEMASAERCETEDVFAYSIDTIRALLLDAFDHEDWPSPGGFEAQTRIVELTDIKVGMSKLNEAQNNVLVWKYRFGYTDDNVASELSISREAAKKRHQRALTSLQRALGYRDPAGTNEARKSRPERSGLAEV